MNYNLSSKWVHSPVYWFLIPNSARLINNHEASGMRCQFWGIPQKGRCYELDSYIKLNWQKLKLSLCTLTVATSWKWNQKWFLLPSFVWWQSSHENCKKTIERSALWQLKRIREKRLRVFVAKEVHVVIYLKAWENKVFICLPNSISRKKKHEQNVWE